MPITLRLPVTMPLWWICELADIQHNDPSLQSRRRAPRRYVAVDDESVIFVRTALCFLSTDQHWPDDAQRTTMESFHQEMVDVE